MTASNFEACLAELLKLEGGFVDDPRDPGGATNLGVTLRTLSGWRRRPCSIADVEALTPADVAPLYRADYWALVHGDELPRGLDLMVFDECVNAGPGHARRHLQEALGVAADGAIGPATLAAAGKADVPAALRELSLIRRAYYQALPGFAHFGRGWLSRVNAVLIAALDMAGAPA